MAWSKQQKLREKSNKDNQRTKTTNGQSQFKVRFEVKHSKYEIATKKIDSSQVYIKDTYSEQI